MCPFVWEFGSPLARDHRDHRELPGMVERFEGIVAGRELCNAFSELNDPDEQRSRFEEQAAQKAAGDAEAMAVDAYYVRALEYGLGEFHRSLHGASHDGWPDARSE